MMTDKIIVIRHVPFEGLGYIEPALTAEGLKPEVREIGAAVTREELAHSSGLIVMGGPMSVNDPDPWVAAEMRAVEHALSLGKPVLGVCLGSQLLAKTLGAAVRRNPVKEIGWFPITFDDATGGDPLFGEFKEPLEVFHWHGETFEIPSGATKLASSERCANQAFRYGDNAYGLQFHPEVSAEMITEWLAAGENCGDVAGLSEPVDPHKRDQAPLARRIFGNWVRQVVLCLLCTVAVFGQSIKLEPYPQKFRQFYSLTDSAAPEAVKKDPGPSPNGEYSAIAVTKDGAVWTGSARGLTRFDSKASVRDRFQLFHSKRYLPDDHVLQVVSDSGNGVWVRTQTGISHIELRPMTLAQKTVSFEQRIKARHDRHGFVASSHIRESGNLSTNQPVSSDNDGLWTAMYAAAECFRYAVTKSPEALANARKATEAVLFLEQITGRPGFPARSYISQDEERPKDGEWHPTADGKYQWKGDTSSDELVGHFLIFGLAWDLLPDPALRKRIEGAARRIMDHIIQNKYHLIDVDGKPTLWGKWSLEYFATADGRGDGPLNALELLSFLKTTHHITGDEKYASEYRKVAWDLGYATLTTRHLELVEELNYSDEELAMLSFYPLFRYETEERYLSVYRKAADQWWKNIQRECNPLWTYIYLVGNKKANVDLACSVWTLHRIPMDLVNWTVTNSHRKDVAPDPKIDRFQRSQSVTLLPPDERPIMKWNGNPFRIDGGSDGKSEDDGAFFLLPYWLGRYHRVLIGE